MDECWLDVTHTPQKAMEIAEEIRQAAKDELGLTVSVGVSFNKIFAKLGSDMKNSRMVMTKSISRFARNTVTLLETVRALKLIGVDVYFEEQNIHTTSADGELMLTILASYAQEESRSVSENMKWRIKKNFEEGLPWNGAMLGYRLCDGIYTIIPEEAEIVKRIFADFIAGKGTNAIANSLNRKGVPTRFGERWHPSVISKILRNYTLEMQTRTKNYEGWTAQIIQHEVDHCNGVLI